MVKSFKIGGIKWTVSEVDTLVRDNGSHLFGECNNVTAKITIANKVGTTPINKDVKEATFYHELVHAFLDIADVPLDEGTNEHIAERLGYLLKEYMDTKVDKK